MSDGQSYLNQLIYKLVAEAGGEMRIPLMELNEGQLLVEEDTEAGVLVVHALPDYVTNNIGPTDEEIAQQKRNDDIKRLSDEELEARYKKVQERFSLPQPQGSASTVTYDPHTGKTTTKPIGTVTGIDVGNGDSLSYTWTLSLTDKP